MDEPPQSADKGRLSSRPEAGGAERLDRLERENALLRKELAACREHERALQRDNERLAKVLEVETVGVMFWDLSTGCLVDANDTFLNTMGYSRHDIEACELTWQKLTPPEYMDLSRTEVAKFLASGRVGPYEKEYFRKDGTRQWFVFAGSSIGGNACVEFCVDIADRKRAEAALRESEERLRLIADALPALISYVDREERYRFANATYEQWFGLPRDQVIGRPVAEVLGTAAYEQVREHLHRALAGERVHYLAHMPYQRGPARETEAVFVPHKDENGDVLGLYSLVQDISELMEHKRSEEALRESERKYRELVENLYEGIWLIDKEERTSFVNTRLAELLGYPAEEMLGRDLFSFMSPQAADAARQNLTRGRIGVHAEYDFEFLCKDGHPIWTHIVTTPLFGAEGDYQGALAGVIDITERKRAEEALHRREQEFEALAERAPDIIARVDRMRRLRYINPAIERVTGAPRESLIGRGLAELPLSPKDRALREQVLKQVFDSGREQVMENEYSAPAGTYLFQARLAPEFGPDGSVESVLVVERDITDLKQTQQALEALTLVDPLTGIANRRYLQQFIDREWRREARHRHPVALIMGDIDHFKAYNDHYGHPQGDECLRQVAGVLRQAVHRPADTLVRFGGEEFAILLPEIDLEAAREVAERARQAVEALNLPHAASPVAERVTLSFGVAALQPHEGEFHELLGAADAALYRAKAKGRNRVETTQ